jgi:hypothetical protein
MKPPFNKLPPGAFDAAFQRPKSQATGLPMGVEQMAKDPAAAHLRGTGLKPGVETQAKQMLSLDQGPMPPMIVNGGRQFQAPAKPNAPLQDLGEQPVTVMPPTRPQGPAAPRLNPLSRGAAAGASSSLGTSITPPNSLSRGARPGFASGLGGPVKVGRSANDPMRIAETARRRGNIAPIMQMVTQQMQEDRADARMERGEQRADIRSNQARIDRMNEWTQSQAAATAQEGRQMMREDQRFDRDTQRRANESSVEWERRKLIMAEEKAARGDPTQVRVVPIPDTDYVIPYAGNQAMGTLRKSQPEAPLPPGMVPQSAMRDGVQYSIPEAAPAAEVKLPKIFQGKADLQGKPGRDYYYEPDPKTGKPSKVYIEDADGDGVPDNQQKVSAAPASSAKADVSTPAKPSRFMDLINAKR